MPQIHSVHWVSPAEYEAGEALATVRHEYVAGEVFAMAGASEQHNRISLNSAMQLRSAARGGPCGVFISDMRIRLAGGSYYYYPDVAVVCDPDDNATHHKERPCIVVEVLSTATANSDRREKWLSYRTLSSLRYYLLVDSRQPRIDYFRRGAAGEWEQGQLLPGEQLTLDCPPRYHATLEFDEVYADLLWPESLGEVL